MADSKLLKEAIADAKAVRETALANAKMAIEEAFTPKIQSMLSTKLQQEIEEEDEFDAEEDDLGDEGEEDEELDFGTEDEIGEADFDDEAEDVDDEIEDVEDELDDVSDELDDVGNDEMDDVDGDEMGDEEEDDLDLEAIIKELEGELDDDEIEDVEDELEDVEDALDDVGDQEEDLYDEDVEVDIDALLRELEDMDDFDEDEMDSEEEVDTLRQEIAEKDAELDEYRSVVNLLRGKLQEVNLLNSKLLYTNKLFRSHDLNNSQKVRVIESLDRAKDVREVKLVYATLAESFEYSGNIKRKRNISESINRGSSKSVKSTKPEKEVLSESSNMVSRFKELAGIKQ